MTATKTTPERCRTDIINEANDAIIAPRLIFSNYESVLEESVKQMQTCSGLGIV